jgi:hypothetical protein
LFSGRQWLQAWQKADCLEGPFLELLEDPKLFISRLAFAVNNLLLEDKAVGWNKTKKIRSV